MARRLSRVVHRSSRILGLAALTLTATCATTDPEQVASIEERSTKECPTVAMLQGVDVSHGDGAIDWVKVKAAGIDFAFIKATQGTYNTQATFTAQWSGAKAAGVARGPYHFFDPTDDGVAQANYFLNVIGTLDADDLPPVLDLECPDGTSTCLGFAGGTGAEDAATIRQRMLDFMTTVKTATGKIPIVYTYGDYLTENAIDTTGFDAFTLWDAAPTTASCFTVPDPWTSAPLWQWSDNGTVDGIGDAVDLDRFVGTLAQLHALGGDVAGDAGSGEVGTGDAARADAGDTRDSNVVDGASDAGTDAIFVGDGATAGDGGHAPGGGGGQGGGCEVAVVAPLRGEARGLEAACVALLAIARRRRTFRR